MNFVLGKWSEDEKAELSFILEKASEAVKAYVAIGIDRAMNLYNK